MLVTSKNWPEAKKDIEAGVTRVRLSEDGTMVRVNSASFVGYDIPIRLARKLAKDGELPETLTAMLGSRGTRGWKT